MSAEIPNEQGQEEPEITSKDSETVIKLLELLEKEQIELPQGIVDRLKLLGTPKCSEGGCENKSYDVTVGDKKVTKKNETHLEHTLELVKILKVLLPAFLRKEDVNSKASFEITQKKIITAALLHDIGKTGPEVGKNGEKIDIDINEDFVLLFSIFEKRREDEGGKNLAECSIREAVERHLPESRQKRVLDSIKQVRIPRKKDESGKEIFFDPDQNKMKDIFGSHVEFSLEILQEYEKRDGFDFDPLIVMLVAKHHRFGNKYDYQPHEELVDSLPKEVRAVDDRLAALIELADTYQAMSSRGTQKGTLETLNTMKEKFINIDVLFNMIIKIIEDKPLEDESLVAKLEKIRADK